MSILDRHPAPWTTKTLNNQAIMFVDANGDTVTTIDGYSGHASAMISTLAVELATIRNLRTVQDAELAAALAENARLREACREMLKVVDGCYAATGHFKVAETSEQRLKIDAALQESRDAI